MECFKAENESRQNELDDGRERKKKKKKKKRREREME